MADAARQSASSSAFVLRAMAPHDLPQVMAIESAAYEFPWTEGIFRDCLRVGYHCRVAESGETLLGYGVMSIGAGECHLLNITVAPNQRRRGIARELVSALLCAARADKVTMALLEVRRSNRAAYALYTSLGFDEIGMRKQYYPTRRGREDALLLARAL